MSVLIERMVRAAKLDPTLYDEVERDEGAMGQAMAVVAISSVAMGIGTAVIGGPFLMIAAVVVALVGWFVWAFICHLVGTRLLPEPGTRADLNQVLRATGFAAAPGVIGILGFLPLLGAVINFAASLWMLAAFVVAVRQVLDYRSTGRAVAVCLIGYIVRQMIFFLFLLTGLGSAFWLLAAG